MDDFYVYSHQDKKGNVFYIGKGTGRRAWQRERHPMWELYVQRIGGDYQVRLIKEGLEEDEALFLEESLQMEHGGNLVNWVNPGRKVNMAIIDSYWNARKENEILFELGKKGENENLDSAISIYKEVLKKMYYYETLDLSEAESYSGTAKVVYKEHYLSNAKYNNGNMEMLDRLTKCLKKSQTITGDD